ncbi:MAG: LytR family transcriptional regulator, partial [Streptomyces albidoflavus]
MTDRAGRPDGQGDEENQGTEGSGAKEQGARWGPRPARQGPARRPFLRRRWVRWTAAGTAVALIGAGFGAWALYDRLQGNITRDDA